MNTERDQEPGISVMHFCPAYFPTRGGIEVLVETMIPLLRSNHRIHSSVVTPRYHNERPDNFTLGGSRVHSVDVFDVLEEKNARKVFVSTLSKVREVMAFEKPDIVHVHGFSPLSQIATARARSFEIPVIAHIHGLLEDKPPPRVMGLVNEADYLIAASTAINSSLERFIGGDKVVHIIRNGITVREPIQPIPNQIRLVVIGRLEPTKGFEDAIRALVHILQRYPRAVLTIIGIGAELYALQKLATLKGVANHVSFLGAIPHDEVLGEIAKASVVIIPSRAIEGFSLVAAEAAMLGRPVVATRVGGLPETVIDGKTGLIVPPESPEEIARAVLTVLDSPKIAQNLASNAASHAKSSFDISRFVSEMAGLYQQIVEREKTSP